MTPHLLKCCATSVSVASGGNPVTYTLVFCFSWNQDSCNLPEPVSRSAAHLIRPHRHISSHGPVGIAIMTHLQDCLGLVAICTQHNAQHGSKHLVTTHAHTTWTKSDGQQTLLSAASLALFCLPRSRSKASASFRLSAPGRFGALASPAASSSSASSSSRSCVAALHRCDDHLIC